MTSKVIGSILMILGTCVGAGMLALPIVSAPGSFKFNVFLLFTTWLIMTISAFAILEVNLWFKPGHNLMSMAEATLGTGGKIVTSLVYLLLMYTLLCAYLSSASGITQTFIGFAHIDVSRSLATLITMCMLGTIVYRGMGAVDIANRFFMSIKLIFFALIVMMLAPHVQLEKIATGDLKIRNSTFIVMITSFGYATILPTLREYLGSNRSALKCVVLVGSLIPFLIFLTWMFVVQGTLDHDGQDGLIAMSSSDNSSSQLMLAITKIISYSWIKYVGSLFVSIYVLTSFICVSISLADFIADGLKKVKKGKDSILIHSLCFLPPLVIVLINPGIFITALTYSGILSVVLLIILPLLMLYRGRYKKALSSDHRIVPGGRWFLSGLLVLAFTCLVGQFL